MLSPDPILQDTQNTQNYNRYSYVWNNPLKYTDPSGYTVELLEMSNEGHGAGGGGGGGYDPYAGFRGLYGNVEHDSFFMGSPYSWGVSDLWKETMNEYRQNTYKVQQFFSENTGNNLQNAYNRLDNGSTF